MPQFADPATVPLIAFLPTPFRHGGVDTAAVAAQMEHYAAHPHLHVGLMGGLGEFYALSLAESSALMHAAAEAAAGRFRVHAAIGFATREAVQLATAAARAGCSDLVINPPYYVKPSPAGLAEHVRAVTEASGLPAVLYSSAGYPITPDHLAALVEVPGFRGIKDEVSTPEQFGALVQEWGERVDFWVVGEHLARAYLPHGAQAVTSALANVCPQASRALLTAPTEDEHLAELVLRSVQVIGAEPGAGASATKRMISAVRDWPGEVRLPQVPISDELGETIDTLMAELLGGWS